MPNKKTSLKKALQEESQKAKVAEAEIEAQNNGKSAASL